MFVFIFVGGVLIMLMSCVGNLDGRGVEADLECNRTIGVEMVQMGGQVDMAAADEDQE